MNTPVRFLAHLARAIAAISLYDAGHPAREGAIERAFHALQDLQEELPTPTFTFLGDSVLLGEWPLRALRNWDWSARMAAVGVQRIEFIDRVTRDDFEVFLFEIYGRLAASEDEVVSSAEIRQTRRTSIRYGEVKMKGEPDGDDGDAAALPTASLGYSLKEEIEGIQWLHTQLQGQKGLNILEASTIVQSLSVAMHSDQSYLIPLLHLKDYDQYTTTHSLNVSVLTMALSEFLGMSPREVRSFGIAGLLHDLGKVKIPRDILLKPGKLSAEERAVMNSHTVEGAKLIIQSEEKLDVAAVVAYEHHARIDGRGYPTMLYKRASHPASALVHVCDVFDALRTDRPYRGAMTTSQALTIIEEGIGTDFDKDVAHAFVRMMGRWQKKITTVEVDEPDIVAAPPEPPASKVSDSVFAQEAADDDDITWVDPG